MIAEGIIGSLASSLARISDARHMLTGVGCYCPRPARHSAGSTARLGPTYAWPQLVENWSRISGLRTRHHTPGAGGSLIIEAVRRLIDPPKTRWKEIGVYGHAGQHRREPRGDVGAFARQLAESERRGELPAYSDGLHAFIATTAAGTLFYNTNFIRFDALAALVVAGLVLRAGISLACESHHLCHKGAPHGLDPTTIATALRAVSGVVQVHDLQSGR
jgi:cobalt-zinc-cadmium efflux system protein